MSCDSTMLEISLTEKNIARVFPPSLYVMSCSSQRRG